MLVWLDEHRPALEGDVCQHQQLDGRRQGHTWKEDPRRKDANKWLPPTGLLRGGRQCIGGNGTRNGNGMGEAGQDNSLEGAVSSLPCYRPGHGSCRSCGTREPVCFSGPMSSDVEHAPLTTTHSHCIQWVADPRDGGNMGIFVMKGVPSSSIPW